MYLLERPRTSGWLSWNGATQRCCHCLLANKTTAHRGFRKMGATPKSSKDIDIYRPFWYWKSGGSHEQKKQKSNLCKKKKTKQLPIAIGNHIYHLSPIIYHLSSIIYHLSSIIYHLSSITITTITITITIIIIMIIYHLSSSSIIYHLSSIIYHRSSIIDHRSSIIDHHHHHHHYHYYLPLLFVNHHYIYIHIIIIIINIIIIIIITTTTTTITIISSPKVGQRSRAVATINRIWLPQNPLCLLSKPPLWIAICLNTFKSFESNLSEVLTWFLRLCIL